MDPRILNAGLDGWMLFGRGEIPAGVTMDLEERQRKALLAKCDIETPWRFGGEPLMLEPVGRGRGTGRRWDWSLHTPSLQLWFRLGTQDGVIARAAPTTPYLYDHGAVEVLNEVQELFVEILRFAPVVEVAEVRLCADMLGWDLEGEGMHSAGPSHSILVHKHDHVPRLHGEGSPTTVHGPWIPATVTSWILYGRTLAELEFAWDTPGTFRLYDKRNELGKHPKATRRYLQSLWEAHGWEEPVKPIWRAEFSYDHADLTKMGLVRPHDLLEHMEAVWAYATADTVRHTKASAKALPPEHRATSAVWALIQRATLRR